MKVLLFGAGGQLGWELQRTCPSYNQLDAVGYPDVDFRNNKSIKNNIIESNPDWIINAAAYTAVDQAERNEKLADQLNHLAVAQISRTAWEKHIKLVHISTDFIFDGNASAPYHPDSPANPQSVYGKTKLDGETALKQILQKNFVVIRTAWLYSSHGNNFVKTMLKLMQERTSLQVVGDQIGTPTWANGLATCIWEVIARNIFGVLHWTDAGVASWYDFTVAIQEEAIKLGLLKKSICIQPIPSENYPTPAKRPLFSVLDKTDTWQTLKQTPVHWRIQLRKMLKELV